MEKRRGPLCFVFFPFSLLSSTLSLFDFFDRKLAHVLLGYERGKAMDGSMWRKKKEEQDGDDDSFLAFHFVALIVAFLFRVSLPSFSPLHLSLAFVFCYVFSRSSCMPPYFAFVSQAVCSAAASA